MTSGPAESPDAMRRRRERTRRRARRVAGLVPGSVYLRARRAHTAGVGGLRGAIAQRFLRLARLLPPPKSHAVFTPAGGPPDVRFAAADSTIVRTLFWIGRSGYETHTLACWDRAAARSQRIVDIGANFGLFTVYAAAANPAASITAVEPHPRSFAVLQSNVALNDAADVRTQQAAVCARGGERLELCVPAGDLDETPGGAFVDAPGGGTRRAAVERYEVPTLAAAEVVRGADLVKIDVEGQEFAILSAASDVLLRERPMIFLEILDESAALTTLLSEWVAASAYGLYFTDEAGRIRRVPDGEVADSRLSSAVGATYDNFMLLDEERHEWFLAAPGGGTDQPMWG